MEKKIAAVQDANTITVEDVVSLLELEGLTVEQEQPGDEFAAQWPDTKVYRLDEANLLLLQSFPEGLWQRQKKLEEIGWYSANYHYQPEQVPVVQQAIAQFPLTGDYLTHQIFQGKNVVAWLIVFSGQYDLSSEDYELVSEHLNRVMAVSKTVQRVFDQDINQMQTETLEGQSDHFTAQVAVQYYQTPLLVDKYPLYDSYRNEKLTVQVDEAVLSQYKGQEIMIAMKGYPGGGSMALKGELTEEELVLGTGANRDICGELWDGYQYQITITVGDLNETIEIDWPKAE